MLFGGADLERAMFYLDTEGRGVNREEFAKIANWVCNQELDPHVVSSATFSGDHLVTKTYFHTIITKSDETPACSG